MTASELNGLLETVHRSIDESAREHEAAQYLRTHLRAIVDQLRESPFITIPVSGGSYRITRDQMREALQG
jgi:hypothetical protein